MDSRELPANPRNEFVGATEEAGRDAGTFEVGDEVIGFTNMRSYAESVVAGIEENFCPLQRSRIPETFVACPRAAHSRLANRPPLPATN